MTTAEAGGPGSRLVEELRLLLDAAAEQAGPWLDRLATDEHAGHDADHGAEGWCPMCAMRALFNEEPADLVARGLDRAADLVALLRAVLADRWEPDVVHMPGFRPARSSRVQRIPVRRKGKTD